MTVSAFATPAPLSHPAALLHSPRTDQRNRRPRVRMLGDTPQRPGPLKPLRDFLEGVRRVSGLVDSDAAASFDVDRSQLFEDDEPPEVLVLGATGATGRIVVRKLLLRGYRVRVVVRDLFSSTLDVLGTGVRYVKGSLDDYDSLLEAAGDVDKVVCAVGARTTASAEAVDYRGVCSLIRAFHDARVAYYGRAEATKLALFHFSSDRDLARWRRVVPTTGAEGARAPRTNFTRTGPGRVAFMGQIFSRYSGVSEIRCTPARFNLADFSGLILRCVGDGKTYTLVLRTAAGVRAGVEYAAMFETHHQKWDSVRVPLSAFRARALPRPEPNNTTPSDDMLAAAPLTDTIDAGAQAAAAADVLASAPALDRGDVRQIAIQYAKPSQSPEKDDGRFYLGVDYMKAYRTQEQPDFVLVSCASVSARDWTSLDEEGLRSVARDDRAAWKYMAEKRLRQSGLTYTIVRPGVFTDQPGGNKALMLEQGGDVSGAISRADVAEICVRSLLDPRACNVTFDAFESMYAPTATTPSQDVSAMLSRLQPNT